MTYEPRELIVMDDDPGAPANLFAEAPNTYYYRTPPFRLGEKLNAAVDLARGDYLLKLDDDDWYCPDYIDRAMSKIERIAPANQRRVVASATSNPVLIASTGELFRWESVWSGWGSGMLFHRDVWKAKQFCEDIESRLDQHFIQGDHFTRLSLDPDTMVYVRHGIGHLYRTVGDGSLEDHLRKSLRPCRKTLADLMGHEEAAFYEGLKS
jgi:glycosyltransferase involved in cell wall biosynthesis